MVKCDICSEELEYLPFKCRYCGKQFCKAHRLPENHKCSFEFKNDPYSAKKLTPMPSKPMYEDYQREPIYEDVDTTEPPEEGFQTRGTARRTSLMRPFQMGPPLKATYIIMIIQVVVFILFASVESLQGHLVLSVSSTRLFWFHTILTSMFNPGDALTLIFNIIILFFIGRTIEGRFGWKTFVELYIVSGLISGALILLIQSILSADFVFGSDFELFGFNNTSGPFMGLISFITLLLPNTQVNVFLMFIPVRLKTRYLLLFFIMFYVVFAIIDLAFFLTHLGEPGNFPSFVIYFGSIFGALGGFLKIRKMQNQDASRAVY